MWNKIAILRRFHHAWQEFEDYGGSIALGGLQYILADLDLILIMTVNPGFGGQSFIPAMVEKIRDCKALIGKAPIELQVDGGVSLENLPVLLAAGATNFVAGSAVFGAEDPEQYIAMMRSTKGQG